MPPVQTHASLVTLSVSTRVVIDILYLILILLLFMSYQEHQKHSGVLVPLYFRHKTRPAVRYLTLPVAIYLILSRVLHPGSEHSLRSRSETRLGIEACVQWLNLAILQQLRPELTSCIKLMRSVRAWIASQPKFLTLSISLARFSSSLCSLH